MLLCGLAQLCGMGTGPQQLPPWYLVLGLTVLLGLQSDGSHTTRLMPWSRPGLAWEPCSGARPKGGILGGRVVPLAARGG